MRSRRPARCRSFWPCATRTRQTCRPRPRTSSRCWRAARAAPPCCRRATRPPCSRCAPQPHAPVATSGGGAGAGLRRARAGRGGERQAPESARVRAQSAAASRRDAHRCAGGGARRRRRRRGAAGGGAWRGGAAGRRAVPPRRSVRAAGRDARSRGSGQARLRRRRVRYRLSAPPEPRAKCCA